MLTTHPDGVRGSIVWYRQGCRCDECRADVAAIERARRRRAAEGKVSEWARVPKDRAQAAVRSMRDQGMTWNSMQRIVGVDGRELQRIMSSKKHGLVTLWMEESILGAAEKVRSYPELAVQGRILVPPSDRITWMVGCLQARGWSIGSICKGLGWNSTRAPSSFLKGRVHVKTVQRLEAMFHERHAEWGPSRVTAVRVWRKGKFPSDCYDWEDDHFDPRPIPGTLHPDLVIEACTYGPVGRTVLRRERLLEMQRIYGQWGNERCAAAALHSWQERFGGPVLDGEACRAVAHRHDDLPPMWEEPAEEPAEIA